MKRVIASLALVSSVLFGFASVAHADEVVVTHPVHRRHRHHRKVVVVHHEPVHHEEVIVR